MSEERSKIQCLKLKDCRAIVAKIYAISCLDFETLKIDFETIKIAESIQ